MIHSLEEVCDRKAANTVGCRLWTFDVIFDETLERAVKTWKIWENALKSERNCLYHKDL